MDANTKATLNEIKEDMKTMQERADADRKRERGNETSNKSRARTDTRESKENDG
jgi:hypothetical protein